MGIWVAGAIATCVLSVYCRARSKELLLNDGFQKEHQFRLMFLEKLFVPSFALKMRLSTQEFSGINSIDLQNYRDFFSKGVYYIIQFLTALIPVFFALFYIHVNFALLSLIPVLCIPFVLVLSSRFIYQRANRVQQLRDRMSGEVREIISHLKEIKMHRNEAVYLNRLHQKEEVLSEEKKKKGIYEGCFFPSLTALTKLITVSLLVYQGVLISIGAQAMTQSAFISFMWIQSLLFLPVVQLGLAVISYQKGRNSYERVMRSIEKNERDASATSQERGLCFSAEGRSYQFVNSGVYELYLNDVHKVFLSLFGADHSNSATYNGLNSLDTTYFEKVGFMHKTPTLVSGSVQDNLWQDEMANAKLIEYMLHLGHLSLTHPVSNQGSNLSGGQKRLVALVRLFAHRFSVWVLYDAFEHFDADLRKKVSQIIETFARENKIIVLHLAAKESLCS